MSTSIRERGVLSMSVGEKPEEGDCNELRSAVKGLLQIPVGSL